MNAGTLTKVARILALSPEQAQAGLPVEIHAVVTCYDQGRILFVQDETAGIFVYHTGSRLPLLPGQHVRVAGLARPGRYSPIIDSPRIEPLATGPLVSPRPVSVDQISLGGLDAQWVELTAVVRAQKVVDNQLMLELADPPHRICLWIPIYQGYEQLPLVGSLARVRGVVGTSVNDRGQPVGFQVFANTLADVVVLNPPPGDPFSTPLRQVRDLRKHYVRSGLLGFVRVQGSITCCRPGGVFFMQDSTGGLEVQTQAAQDDLVPGTVVDAAGYLGPLLGALRLEDAVIRKLGTNAPPQAARALPEDLFNGRHYNQLVEVEAGFLGQAAISSNGIALALQEHGRFLTAVLEMPHAREALAMLEPGSQIRLTGVCRPEAGAGTGPAVSLILRSPLDVRVVRPPVGSGALALKVLASAAILAAAGLAAAFWIILRQRTRTQASLQAEMRQGEQQLRRSLEERERIGRDLHDDIIQSIYAAGLSLEDCRRMVRKSPEQVETRLAASILTLNNAIGSVRGFIAGLEPKVLNAGEFKIALKSLALTSGDGPTQFKIDVDPAAANQLTSTQATQLLHIAKEAMSNCLRHAHASGVIVSLHPAGAGSCLEIRDDGAGFDPAASGGAGHGLRNMAARAREMEADMKIVSAPDQGCRILVTVPQRNANEPQ